MLVLLALYLAPLCISILLFHRNRFDFTAPIVYIGVFSTFGIGAAILLRRSPAQLADRLSTSTEATDERST